MADGYRQELLNAARDAEAWAADASVPPRATAGLGELATKIRALADAPDAAAVGGLTRQDLDRFHHVLSETEAMVRTVDPHQWLTQFDTRMSDVSAQIRALETTNARIKQLLTMLEDDRQLAAKAVTRSEVVWIVAAGLVAQLIVLVAILSVLR